MVEDHLFISAEGGINYEKVTGVPRRVNLVVAKDVETRVNGINMYSKEWSEEVVLGVYGNYKMDFDYVNYSINAIIVSEKMLQFLNEKGFKKQYDKAAVKAIVNKSGKELVMKKQYYVMRMLYFDDQSIEFGSELTLKSVMHKSKFYPDMRIKENSAKQIFSLKEPSYNDGLIFSQQIKEELEKGKFIIPKIYGMKEYSYVYTGAPRPEVVNDRIVRKLAKTRKR